MSRAIIYCQLQHDISRCFWASLKQTRKFWDGDIYLIAPRREKAYWALKKHGVIFIDEESYYEDVLIKQYESSTFFNTLHPGWDGFWDNTCKRFFYIYILQRNLNINETIHFETDVVPYHDITDMFNKFEKAYKSKMVFSHHAPYQLSCCTTYCNSIERFKAFCTAIIEYFNRGHAWFSNKYPTQTILNETHFAYTFQQENPAAVELFPTLPTDKLAKTFDFVIDPTAWGMWVDGLRWNPGNNFATENHTIGKLIINDKYRVLFTPSKNPYIFDKSTTVTTPLATLHFNSKEPERWI